MRITNKIKNKTSKTTLSSKKIFVNFEKETREIRMILDLARKEQTMEISTITSIPEINFYKI